VYTVSETRPAVQAARHETAVLGPAAEVHPPKRSGRAGDGVQEARWAGELAPPFSHHQSTLFTDDSGVPGPAGDASPWYIGDNCCTAGQQGSAETDDGANKRATVDRRPERYRLRNRLAKCTVHERFGKQIEVCGAPGLPVDGVTTGGMMRIRRKDGTAFPADVSTCGSVFCPVCGPKIRAKRAEKFTTAIGRWFARGPDHDGWFITLNARNTAGLPEAEAVDRALKGWQRLRNRRSWRQLADRYGLHYIKAIDVTHGEDNGWNVHLHIALMTVPTCRGPIRTFAVAANGEAVVISPDGAQVLADLAIALRQLWPDVMGRLGFYASPRQVHIEQIDVRTAAGVGGYLAKQSAWGIGDELARLDLKQGNAGRTYEQIVADYDDHQRESDLALIHEHHEALYGRRHFSWSQGFRELLGMVDEQTDEEADADSAADPEEADDVAGMDGRTYYTMLRRHQVPGLLAVADHGDYVGVRAYVIGLGYRLDAVWEPRPDLTRRRKPRDRGGGRYSRTEVADRHHVPIAEVHGRVGPVAGCLCEACRS
jgi:Replication protein